MAFMKLAGTSMKNLFHKSSCKMYPVVPLKTYEATRGPVENNIETCVLCSLCAKNCPVGAIEVNKKERYWQFDPYICIRCGECVSRCPKHSLSMDPNDDCTAPQKSVHHLDKPEEPEKESKKDDKKAEPAAKEA